MHQAPKSSGFAQNKPVGKFANTDTSVCNSSRPDAIAEMEREANVRMKCYDRWVSEGKMTPEDAQRRMDAIVSAWHYLNDTPQAQERSMSDAATAAGH